MTKEFMQNFPAYKNYTYVQNQGLMNKSFLISLGFVFVT